jgi:hypothetical protein
LLCGEKGEEQGKRGYERVMMREMEKEREMRRKRVYGGG